MALDKFCLDLIAPFLRGADILCLAYPDIIEPAEKVKEYLGISEEITEFTQHGGAHKRMHPLPETLHVLQLAGAGRVDVVDVKVLRGIERVVDLNATQEWPASYDIVINPGTLEHCFDVAEAWRNAWRAVKIGGVILHVAPTTMMNHGFWSMNPTLYFDFADANGGEVLGMVTATLSGVSVPFETRVRFALPENCVLYCLMRKNAAVPLKNPTQWKYR